MPIYEYECAACRRTFEAWQKIDERPVEKCGHCGSSKVSRLISQSSFHLKGSGWYVTDYARKDKGKAEKDAKREAKSETKSTKWSEGSTD